MNTFSMAPKSFLLPKTDTPVFALETVSILLH